MPRSLAALLALALPLTATGLLSAPHSAAAAETATSGGGADGAVKSASEADAFALAKSSGERVEIIDRREESAETFAKPDGSLIRRQYATPVWTRYDRTWKKADATVVQHEDGTVGPAAPVFGITFSSGGTVPLATMTKGDKQLALSWPTALPKPVLDGTTALYKSVLPDVDLKVIAEVDGFAEHLIVNTAAAAANPALKSIKLGIATKNVTLADDAGDNLTAKDAAGKVVFSAPRPKMWEQPPTSAPEAAAEPAAKTKTTTLRSSAAGETAEKPSTAPVGVDVAGSTLTLTPDPALLAAANQFPLVIDPQFGDGSREKWAVVYSDTPSSAYPNGSGWHSGNPVDEPRVGYNGTGATASFFAMNIDGIVGATVTDATFAVEETYSWGCDANAAGPTELWSSTDISATPTWNTRGNYYGHYLAQGNFAHGHPNCPGVQGYDFKSAQLTALVQEGADKGWDPLVFAVRAASSYEWNVNSFKRLRNNPALEVTYNFKPTVDIAKAYEGNWAPGAQGNKEVPCNGAIGNSGLVMTAKITDKDGGQVTGIFKVNNAANQDVSFPNNWQTKASGDTVTGTIPASSLSSGTYTWRVYAQDDENTTSASTPWCSFTVDKEGPAERVKVTVSRPRADGTGNDIKPADDITVKFKARATDTFTLSNPANDLAGFCWAMDHPVSVSNTLCEGGNRVDVAAGVTSVNIIAEPTGYPNSQLYVWAYDKAGNHSPVDGGVNSVTLSMTPADFVYGSGPLEGPVDTSGRDRTGDLTGDGYPDLLATDSSSNLLLYPGDGTGKVGNSTIVDHGGYGVGTQIAHGGDFTGMALGSAPDGYEDYLVRSTDGNLYIYPNNGRGIPWSSGRRALGRPSSSGTTDWKRLQKIITPGDIDQNTTADHARGNDLITIECADGSDPCTNGELWLYSGRTLTDGRANQATPFDFADEKNGYHKLGWGWQDYTNLALGDLNGDNIKDLVARNAADGKLYLYPGKITNGVYGLGDRTVYGSAGWVTSNRPHIASPGNVQGTVVTATYTDPDNPTKPIPYRQWQPKPGEEYGDWWATTPANPNVSVSYVDDTGAAKTTTSPSGCLLFYAGGPGTGREPRLLGCGGWDTYITNIF